MPDSVVVLKQRLRDRFGARLASVRVFGSYARGEAHDESDVDVLVLVEGLTHGEKIEVIEVGAEISLESGDWLAPLAMDPVRYDELRRLHLRLALDIEREGIEA